MRTLWRRWSGWASRAMATLRAAWAWPRRRAPTAQDRRDAAAVARRLDSVRRDGQPPPGPGQAAGG